MGFSGGVNVATGDRMDFLRSSISVQSASGHLIDWTGHQAAVLQGRLVISGSDRRWYVSSNTHQSPKDLVGFPRVFTSASIPAVPVISM
jgi:hypothetical protein